MNSIASISTLSGGVRPITVERLRRELLVAHVQSTRRREALAGYLLKLVALGLSILLATFLVQLAAVLGGPLTLSGRTADVVWLAAVAVAAAATLVASVSWRRTRLLRLQGELHTLELRFQLEMSDDLDWDDRPA